MVIRLFRLHVCVSLRYNGRRRRSEMPVSLQEVVEDATVRVVSVDRNHKYEASMTEKGVMFDSWSEINKPRRVWGKLGWQRSLDAGMTKEQRDYQKLRRAIGADSYENAVGERPKEYDEALSLARRGRLDVRGFLWEDRENAMRREYEAEAARRDEAEVKRKVNQRLEKQRYRGRALEGK